MSTWTDERTTALVKLVGDGLSAQQIADRLGGVSRCAVIGKIHRAKDLQLKGKPSSAGGFHRGQRDIEAPVTPAEDPVYVEPEVFLQPLPVTARPWLQRLDNECSFPVGGEGADTLFCCAPADRGGYCAGHFRVLYPKAKAA